MGPLKVVGVFQGAIHGIGLDVIGLDGLDVVPDAGLAVRPNGVKEGACI